MSAKVLGSMRTEVKIRVSPLTLAVPLPWSRRVWALPFLTVEAPSRKVNEKNAKRHKTAIGRTDLSRPFQLALAAGLIKESESVLDYGCGDGYFLQMCLEVLSAENLVGYEPDPVMYQEAVRETHGTGIVILRTLDELHNKAFTKITCLETGEHLVGQELDTLLVNIERLLAQRGRIVISVPLEIGVPALLKNTFRILKGHIPDNFTFLNFWRMVFGVSIPRSTPENREHGHYIYSHMGFDHRQFEEMLARAFCIEKKYFFGWFGYF